MSGSTVVQVIFETMFARAALAEGATQEEEAGIARLCMAEISDEAVTLERTLQVIGIAEKMARAAVAVRDLLPRPEDPHA
jgi:hypothetical protein